MDDLPAELQAFLGNHSCLQLTESKKIKCLLNGHEFPCNLTELQKFTSGKKYQKLSSVSEFNYSQYEPHIVPSTKQPNQLFCKLTLRHLNRQPHHVMGHVNGKRFKKAMAKYEECARQGTEFVPARLKQKRPKNSDGEGRERRNPKRGNSMWEPASSDEEGSDSEDSMSDLYPSHMFCPNKAEHCVEVMDDGGKEEESDFKTDDEEGEDMEVDKLPKRRKVQGGGLQKKLKNNNWKKKV